MNATIRKEVEFEGIPLKVIEEDGQEWFLAEDIGKALGLAEPRKAVNKIFNRNKDEFEGLTRVTNLVPTAKTKDLPPLRPRVFNAEAAVIIGFFANTERAKAFRKWASRFLTKGVAKLQARLTAQAEKIKQLQGQVKALPAPERSRQKRFRELEQEMGKVREAANALLDRKSQTIRKLNAELDDAQQQLRSLPALGGSSLPHVTRQHLFSLQRLVPSRDPLSGRRAGAFLTGLLAGKDPYEAAAREEEAIKLLNVTIFNLAAWKLLRQLQEDPSASPAERQRSAQGLKELEILTSIRDAGFLFYDSVLDALYAFEGRLLDLKRLTSREGAV